MLPCWALVAGFWIDASVVEDVHYLRHGVSIIEYQSGITIEVPEGMRHVRKRLRNCYPEEELSEVESSDLDISGLACK